MSPTSAEYACKLLCTILPRASLAPARRRFVPFIARKLVHDLVNELYENFMRRQRRCKWRHPQTALLAGGHIHIAQKALLCFRTRAAVLDL